MTPAPDWVVNPRPCPIEGCKEEMWIDVGGSNAHPSTEYHTSCDHEIEKCVSCDGFFGTMDLSRFSWPAKKYETGPGYSRSIHLCDGCFTYNRIRELVPERVLQEKHPEWWE